MNGLSCNSVAEDGRRPTAESRSLRRALLALSGCKWPLCLELSPEESLINVVRMQMTAVLGAAALGLLLGLPAGLGLAYLAWEWVDTNSFLPSQKVSSWTLPLFFKIEKESISHHVVTFPPQNWSSNCDFTQYWSHWACHTTFHPLKRALKIPFPSYPYRSTGGAFLRGGGFGQPPGIGVWLPRGRQARPPPSGSWRNWQGRGWTSFG